MSSPISHSGNILFNSALDEAAVKSACEKLIEEDFGLDIPVCVIAASDLIESLTHAPVWWNKSPDAKHNAFFVIPPMTAAGICAHAGAIEAEYEKVSYHGRVIF